ncbi:MAG TPA: sigma-70 family RNA polymerase sigma factor [Terriglobales bacterium]|nr:sigma-70 family RNA polymerase sigma factor [Terriglobales bacterium]
MKPQPAARESSWPDERLVQECNKGNQAAWSALIEKYKNLIFSIPIKFGLPREDAADVFQAVCVDLLVGLPRLREPKALPKWLMQTSFHQCLRHKKDRLSVSDERFEVTEEPESGSSELPEEILSQVQREQSLREAIAALPPRCKRMVGMLFFEDPPRPYEEVAKELKLATGSIGFIRGRCLKKLRALLEDKGFK